MGVQILLLMMTILLLESARTLRRFSRVSVLSTIVAAIILDAAALVCAFGEPYWPRQEVFIADSRSFQSNLLRQAILDQDVERAQRTVERNPRLLPERGLDGQNALSLATKGGDKPMVEMLLEHGALPGAKDRQMVTPLHLAAESGDLEIARLLLGKGAGANAEDMWGKTPLAHAKAAGHKAMVDLLVEHGGAQDADYESLLIEAVKDRNVQQVAALLEQGGSVNTSAPSGRCLLDFAAEAGDLEMAKFLISQGASARRAAESGRTALHWASGKGNAEMVRFLIEQGADANAREHRGMTPLFDAIFWSQLHENKSLESVRALVEDGADVNAGNHDDVKPLQYAGKYGTDSIRAYLRDRGASN